MAETINGLYKAEVIHRRGPWRSFEAIQYATLEWVDWFNYRRLLKPSGNIPPAEAGQQYYAAAENLEYGSVTHNPRLRQTRGGSRRAQASVLGGAHIAIATAVHASIVMLAANARHSTGGRPARLGRFYAIGLVAVAIWLAWSTRRIG